MAVMNFEFQLKNFVEDEYMHTPWIDYIALYNKDGNICSLNSSNLSSYKIEDGMYKAKFKGVNMPFADGEFEEVTAEDVVEIRKMLPQVNEVEIGIYAYGYGLTDVEASDLVLELSAEGETLTFEFNTLYLMPSE